MYTLESEQTKKKKNTVTMYVPPRPNKTSFGCGSLTFLNGQFAYFFFSSSVRVVGVDLFSLSLLLLSLLPSTFFSSPPSLALLVEGFSSSCSVGGRGASLLLVVVVVVVIVGSADVVVTALSFATGSEAMMDDSSGSMLSPSSRDVRLFVFSRQLGDESYQ